MRVGLFVDHFDPDKGGMEVAVAQLVRRLLESGHDACVYGLSAVPDAPGSHRRVEVSTTRRGELERELAERSLVAARADACDVTLAVRHAAAVDVYWPHGGSHAATLAAGEASKGGVTGALARLLHRASPRHRVFHELERAALTGGARAVWCVSTLVHDELASAYPGCAGRLELHRNGVDRTIFDPTLREAGRARVRAALDLPGDAAVLLFMGSNLRLKGWDVLLAALAHARGDPWVCVVAGADVAQVARDARSVGIGDRIRAVAHRSAIELYSAADLLVQPTFRDPCSLATLEALSSGVPVLTTSANGASDAITSSAAGGSVPVGDRQAFSTALRSWIAVVSDPEARAASSVAARGCTEDRGAHAWLAGMVAALERLAG